MTESGSGEVRYLLSDGLGSIRQAVDEVGAVVTYSEFNPYGSPTRHSPFADSPFAFTREWWEDDVELLHLRARWYSPENGIFLSRDSWNGNDKHPLTMNSYLYVLGNPLKYIDPSGLHPPGMDYLDKDCTIHEVVKFIVNRMRQDSTSQEIKKIRELNETHYLEDALKEYEKMPWWQKILFGEYLRIAQDIDGTARNRALVQFGCLVADGRSRPVCGQWDYKVEIGRLPPNGWGQAQKVDFCSTGHNEEVIFYYDVWANIHFGYLGMTGGFSEQTLLAGADIEQIVSVPGQSRDDPSDKVSVKIGIDLYNSVLSEQTLLRQVYKHRYELNKARVKDGRITEIYR